MSIMMMNRIKALEEFRRNVEAAKNATIFPENGLGQRLRDLELKLQDLGNKYHMLNARLNKKNNNDETQGRRDRNSS
jgi:hypothetical protein